MGTQRGRSLPRVPRSRTADLVCPLDWAEAAADTTGQVEGSAERTVLLGVGGSQSRAQGRGSGVHLFPAELGVSSHPPLPSPWSPGLHLLPGPPARRCPGAAQREPAPTLTS